MASAGSQTRLRARGDDRDASTREQILDAALEAFSLQGFDGATTRAIAARAGVNQGLIPYYFGTKQALWREAVDRAFASLHAAVGEIVEAESERIDREAVARLMRRYVAFVAAHPEFVMLMNEEGKRSGARMRWIVDRHVRPIFSGLTDLLVRSGLMSQMPPHVSSLHLNYIFVGAVGTIFHQRPECQRLMDGYDPVEPAHVRAHADALVHLFFGDVSLGLGGPEEAS